MSTALPTNFDIDGSVGGAIASAADGVGRTSGFSLQLKHCTFNNYSSDDIEQLTNEIMVTAGQFAKRKEEVVSHELF